MAQSCFMDLLGRSVHCPLSLSVNQFLASTVGRWGSTKIQTEGQEPVMTLEDVASTVFQSIASVDKVIYQGCDRDDYVFQRHYDGHLILECVGRERKTLDEDGVWAWWEWTLLFLGLVFLLPLMAAIVTQTRRRCLRLFRGGRGQGPVHFVAGGGGGAQPVVNLPIGGNAMPALPASLRVA